MHIVASPRISPILGLSKDLVTNNNPRPLFTEHTPFPRLWTSVSTPPAAQETQHAVWFAVLVLHHGLTLIRHVAPASRLIQHDLNTAAHGRASRAAAGPMCFVRR